ncbi:hypothetical protein Scep_012964 [Stephania cephalantha]|uniref:Uncharacterized protein n=1 Tax=Stephania cephalantha TaxID=152367 RepID=A0AAP0PAB3_9MAGN
MDDFEAPSFSLGLDLDFDSETLTNLNEQSIAQRTDVTDPTISVISDESFDEDEQDFRGRDLGREEEQRRVFKRLKRGSQTQPLSTSCGAKIGEVGLGLKVDEEIEEFSSQEDGIGGEDLVSRVWIFMLCCLSEVQLIWNCFWNTHLTDLEVGMACCLHSKRFKCICHKFLILNSISLGRSVYLEGSSLMQSHSLCSSSKLTQNVLTRQSWSKAKGGKTNPVSGASASINLEASDTKLMFPKLISPIRRFQLLDSDSDLDDTPIIENRCNDPHVAVLSAGIPRIEDLWKNFTPKEAASVSTPALDNFFEEYYRSSKDNTAAQCSAERMHLNSSKGYENCINGNAESCWISQSLPPAYQYFFHDDPRIQRLVRDRMPSFFPIGVVDDQENKSEAAAIDYMHQFGYGETSYQFYSKVYKILEGSSRGAKRNVKSSRTKEVSQVSNIWQDPKSCVSKVQGGRAKGGRKNAKKACAREASEASSSWMNPKSAVSNSKDAGRRRVHADSHSVGHWYTGEDGRKVYVSKNGQEYTGRMAYRQYKKESGAGFKRSRKKTISKKKSGRGSLAAGTPLSPKSNGGHSTSDLGHDHQPRRVPHLRYLQVGESTS